MTEHDDRVAAISRELARLRRQGMFVLLTEQDQARRSRLLVQLRTAEGERAN